MGNLSRKGQDTSVELHKLHPAKLEKETTVGVKQKSSERPAGKVWDKGMETNIWVN